MRRGPELEFILSVLADPTLIIVMKRSGGILTKRHHISVHTPQIHRRQEVYRESMQFHDMKLLMACAQVHLHVNVY